MVGIINHKTLSRASLIPPALLHLALRPLLLRLSLVVHGLPRLVAPLALIPRGQHLAHLPFDSISHTLAPVLHLAPRFFLLAAGILVFTLATQSLVAERGADGLFC